MIRLMWNHLRMGLFPSKKLRLRARTHFTILGELGPGSLTQNKGVRVTDVFSKSPKRCLFVLVLLFATCWAQAPQDSLLGANRPDSILFPLNTRFEVTNSSYLTIAVTSSDSISMQLESVPEVISLSIQPSVRACSTQLTIAGLAPSTLYYKYVDGFAREEICMTNGNGAYSFIQRLDSAHMIIIRPRPSTIHIPPLPGTTDPRWNAQTRTLTLTGDINEVISIDADSVTLDGANHVATPGWNFGLYAGYRKGATIKNLTVTGATAYGVYLWQSNGFTITNCNVNANRSGIQMVGSSRNRIVDCQVNGNLESGISLLHGCSTTVVSNCGITGNQQYGLYLFYGVAFNTIKDCNISENRIGVHAGEYANFNNVLANDIIGNTQYGISFYLGSANTAIQNRILNNQYGILVGYIGGTQIIGNRIEGNQMGIHHVGSHTTLATKNAFIHNGVQALSEVSYFNPFKNYWSQWTTPDRNGDGYVDTIMTVIPIFDRRFPVVDSLPLANPYGPGISSIEIGLYAVDEPVVIRTTANTLLPNNAPVGSIRYSVDGDSVWHSMNGVDGAFDETVETAVAEIAAFAQAGIHTICFRAFDTAGYFGVDTCTSFEVLAYRSTSVTAGDAACQYSDTAVLTATLTSQGGGLAGKTIIWTVAGIEMGSAVTDANGMAVLRWKTALPANGYNVIATFAEDQVNHYRGSESAASLAISAESSTVACAGAPIVPYPTALGLRAHVTQENDGSIGDPSKAQVQFAIKKTSSDGTTIDIGSYTLACNTAGDVDSAIAVLPGVYSITMTVAGNYFYSIPEIALVPVYDPNGGFATGGGWINVTNTAEGDLGRANFGFVAKYKDASSTGNLEFQYKDGNIDMKSTSIDWLVISSVNAQFQGTATITGRAGLFTFRVNCTDNQQNGNPDKFTITIWAGDDAEADPIYKALNQNLAGGNILVKSK